jgi:hypothetical protein
MVFRMHGRHLAPLHQQHHRQQQLAHQSYVLDPATRHEFQASSSTFICGRTAKQSGNGK